MSESAGLKIEQVDVDGPWGCRLKVQVFGDVATADTTFLCVHGYMDNSNSFLPLAQILVNGEKNEAGSSFCMIAIDMPGQGLSSHLPNPMLYGFRSFVLAVRCVVAHFRLAHYVLVGHSLGCLISLAVNKPVLCQKSSFLCQKA